MMKKVLALLLSLICVFSVFAVTASATIDDVIGEVFPTEQKGYVLHYEKDTLDGVSMMYKPNPNMTLSGPGYVRVTSDTPIAIDHDFVCWRDKTGKLYYEGDRIYINGEVTLYAVWEEKTDNDTHTIRVIKTALRTFQRMIYKVLGIIKEIEDYEESYYSTTTAIFGPDEADWGAGNKNNSANENEMPLGA